MEDGKLPNKLPNKKIITEEECKLLGEIFFNKEEIYDEYARVIVEQKYIREDIKSFILFIRTLAKAGFDEDDKMRFNGITNFCTTFLLKNNLLDEEETENLINGGKE